ncbi:MFS transporter [Candidatus Bathyarchaeota archaeon]|nr:MFS transporter [Candidatus Bathyarchaeota archaeon]
MEFSARNNKEPAELDGNEVFFIILCVMGAFAILSSTMSKNPVLNPFAESLGTPEAFMGFVAAASTLPGVLISFPAGSLSDIVGRRKILLVSAIIFASAPFLYTFINSWWQLILVRFYHGFATAIFVPVARAALAEYYPSRRGEKISTFTSATIVGRSAAPFLGGFILSLTLWNYRMVYLAVGLFGILTLAAGLMLSRQVTDKPARRSEKRRNVGKLEGFRVVLRNHSILIASVTEAAARYVYGALEFFLVGYLKNVAKMDPSLIGIIMGMQLILIPIINPFMGRLSDRVGRKLPIIGGLVLGGISILAIPYNIQFIPLLLISVTFGLCFSMIISSAPALVGDLADKESYGAAMGFLATIMDIGQMAGPIFTGFIMASFGYSGSFFSLGAVLIAVGVAFSIYTSITSKIRRI